MQDDMEFKESGALKSPNDGKLNGNETFNMESIVLEGELQTTMDAIRGLDLNMSDQFDLNEQSQLRASRSNFLNNMSQMLKSNISDMTMQIDEEGLDGILNKEIGK